jgi:hypothetical protein
MAQRSDTSDQPAIDRRPSGRWSTLRIVEPEPSFTAVAGTTMQSVEDGVQDLGEPDPGLVWMPGLPIERASADLTMRDLLSTWRAAERRLERVPEGDEEWSLIREQISALREAYKRLFAQIRPGSPAR